MRYGYPPDWGFEEDVANCVKLMGNWFIYSAYNGMGSVFDSITALKNLTELVVIYSVNFP